MSAYREQGAVHLSVRLEPGDLDAEWALSARRDLHPARLAVAATVALGGVVYLLTLPWGVSHAALAVAAGLVTWMMVKLRPRLDVASIYGDEWEQRRELRLEADEEGILIGDPLSETRLAWELVLAWEETERAFRIHLNPWAVYTIPKRVFASDEQRTALRRLLTHGVREGGEAHIASHARVAWVPAAVYQVALALLLMSVVEAVARLSAAILRLS